MTDLAERRGLDGDVYEPAEDSRLLASTAVEHVDADDLVLDVGTGTGFVAATVAEETGAAVVGTDFNPHACRRARENGVETVRADLLDPIATGAVDVVTCNPPYLPETPELDADDWMDVALTAGEDGRAVVEPFLADVGRALRPGGRVLLLVSSLTGVDEVVDLAADAGFSAAVVGEESFPFETLTALKLVR